jgi:hypothetical protein
VKWCQGSIPAASIIFPGRFEADRRFRRAFRKARERPEALEFVRFLAAESAEWTLETRRRCWR